MTAKDPSSHSSLDRELPSVCVISQPGRRPSGKTHVHQLLDILAESTPVAMLTANLAPDSPVWKEHEVVELTQAGTGDSLLVTVFRFIRNQAVMARAVVRRYEPVILFFGTTAYLLPMLAAKILGKTVVVEPRGDVPLSLRLKWANQVPKPVARGLAGLVSLLEHAGYALADAIVTYTPGMAEELGLGRYSAKLHTDGARYVDLDHFHVETKLEDRPMAVGYLGRLDVEKNVPILIEVAKRLPADITFRFVGDGDYMEELERELSDEIDSGRVTVSGWVDHEEVPSELNRMRLLLLPSAPTEGLPTVVLEAFACGTPVYATPVAGVSDVVKEGKTGHLMTTDHPDAIVETIDDVIRSDLGAMSERCRNEAEVRFSFEAAVNRYRSILESL